jgi:hypothetical protein
MEKILNKYLHYFRTTHLLMIFFLNSCPMLRHYSPQFHDFCRCAMLRSVCWLMQQCVKDPGSPQGFPTMTRAVLSAGLAMKADGLCM